MSARAEWVENKYRAVELLIDGVCVAMIENPDGRWRSLALAADSPDVGRDHVSGKYTFIDRSTSMDPEELKVRVEEALLEDAREKVLSATRTLHEATRRIAALEPKERDRDALR